MKVGDVISGYELFDEITGHGSERRFFRCRKEGIVSVMVHDQDIEQHLVLQKHLARRKIAVPQVFWSSTVDKIMVQEDLGSFSLYELCKNGEIRMDIYKKAIDELIRLQFDGREGAPIECRYDTDHIRWEQEYFRDHFLIEYCGLTPDETAALEPDFGDLTLAVMEACEPLDGYLMHRDYQSQNIYFKEGRIRLIDFQSARIGPLTYDLAALLRDAYVEIRPVLEETLRAYYYEKMKERGVGVDREAFVYCYKLIALQRSMQALGAFANLSLNKKKPHFAHFIPRGLELLERGLNETPFTKLTKAVSSMRR
ncbi:MAG: phosphotransferase [candidate division WOR-3 bacterium]|nr:MAG: phosphotransferase [candidate division WOR-3 bacterium]